MGIYRRIKNRWDNFSFKMKGVVLLENARIDGSVDILNHKNLKLGVKSILYKNTSIYIGSKGRVTIGNHSHIAPFGYLLIDNNELYIGNDVAIGPFCTFICHSNNIEGKNILFTKNYLDADITIGNNVFIGAQCVVLPGTIIQDNVVIASNSVVKGTLESGAVYGGSPAKKIKTID